uniref:Major facilitator superfamily (MFS) profile domain-containing protein n=1 Tax=Panagrolaimus sp. PS1159 TaxID=55785 RepID=A0AC35G7R1_9BILA
MVGKWNEFANVGEKQTSWRSIYVAGGLSFVGAVQFSLYFSALWPYLQTLDKGTTETFYGYIVAGYSVGQICSAPSFGYWSNKLKQVKIPLYIGLFLMFIGNTIYLSLEIIPFPAKFVLFIGRFITGVGSSNSCLLRTYASTASTSKDRSRAIAYVTCGQALGATFGPVFQLFFTPLGYPGLRYLSLGINIYTAPAYFACLMNVAGAFALYFLFKEVYAGVETTPSSSPTASTSSTDNNKNLRDHLPSYDTLAVITCYITRFTQMFVNTNLETIGSAFAMMMFGFSETKAVSFTAAAQGGVGILTFGVYLAYIFLKLENYVSSRKASFYSLIGLLLFHLLTYSWPFIPGNVPLQNSTTNVTNFGCNVNKFSWCESLSPVNVYLYYSVYVLIIGVAFPTLNITTTTLFSKILGPRRQGTQQGILQASGSIARIIGPLGISVLYTDFGPRMTWNTEIAVIGITLLCWIIFYKRMIPLSLNLKNTSEEEMIEKSPKASHLSLIITEDSLSDSDSSTPSSPSLSDDEGRNRMNTFDSTMPLTSKRAQNVNRI